MNRLDNLHAIKGQLSSALANADAMAEHVLGAWLSRAHDTLEELIAQAGGPSGADHQD